MRAVMLFSAVLHIAAVGVLAAYALRRWMDARRPKELEVPEYVAAAAALGVAVAVLGTVLMWMGRGFGTAVATGLAAGAVVAVAFLLTLGAMPRARPGHGGEASVAMRMTAAGLVAALVLTQVIAFCFLVARAGTVAAYS